MTLIHHALDKRRILLVRFGNWHALASEHSVSYNNVHRRAGSSWMACHPTAVMEEFAEHSLDHPATGRPVPIVLFVPGFRVPHMSRTYHFLTQSSQPLLMYRGEDI
jgi:hypothetical protein